MDNMTVSEKICFQLEQVWKYGTLLFDANNVVVSNTSKIVKFDKTVISSRDINKTPNQKWDEWVMIQDENYKLLTTYWNTSGFDNVDFSKSPNQFSSIGKAISEMKNNVFDNSTVSELKDNANEYIYHLLLYRSGITDRLSRAAGRAGKAIVDYATKKNEAIKNKAQWDAIFTLTQIVQHMVDARCDRMHLNGADGLGCN